MSATAETFVLATANPDKAEEIRAIVADRLRLVMRPSSVPDVEETGATLLENALLKASALAQATGLAAVADDTGLEVAALDGAPGIYAARYAGEQASYADNVAKLLREMGGAKDRGARFVTVAVAAWPDGRRVHAEGVLPGLIATAPRGRGGFGYDPIFVPTESDGRTLAELAAEDPEAKNALSHRGRAFRALVDLLVGTAC